MRSAVPKVLHELCGRPMGLWPVVAALEAGAGRVVVVDSPARPWRRCCRRVSELVVQPVSNGTGGRGARGRAGDRPRGAGGRAERRRAAGERGGDRRAGGGPRRGWGGGDDGHARCWMTPPATAAWCATSAARWRGWWRPRRRATPPRRSSRSARSTPASTRSTAGALLAALPRLSADNAQGELYLPQVLDLLRADGAAVPPTRSTTRTSCSASTTAWRSPRCGRSRSARSSSGTCARG